MGKLTLGKFTFGTLLFFVSLPALADLGEKAPLQINFNEMIEETAGQKAELENKMDSHYNTEELDLEVEDSQKVIDFVDVEVQWGESPQVVDRRFNSIDEPRVEELNAPGVEAYKADPASTVQVAPKKDYLPN